MAVEEGKMPRITGARFVFALHVVWSRWVIGVEFLAFPWWGSAMLGPLELAWHRETTLEMT